MDYSRVFDTMVEVIDPVSGSLVVSERVDPFLMGFLDDGHVAAYAEDAFGVPVISVFEVHLSTSALGGE